MFDVGTILHPLSTEKFITDFWPNRLYVTTGESSRFQPLYEIDHLDSAEALLNFYPSEVSLQRPDGFTARVPNGRTAVRFFNGGFTCYLRDLARYIPRLGEVASQLTQDLGLPKNSITCEVFCSNADSGASMHSDFDLNFHLMLSGKKRWMLAPNHHIVNQTEVCLSGGRKQKDPFQLQLAHTKPFPSHMPDDAQTFDLEAGGALFIPRGFWHQTQSSGECLSLVFCMKGPDWLRILLRALENRLIMDPAWRNYPHSVCGTDEQRRAALEEFATLLPHLTHFFTPQDYLTLAKQLAADAKLE